MRRSPVSCTRTLLSFPKPGTEQLAGNRHFDEYSGRQRQREVSLRYSPVSFSIILWTISFITLQD